MTIISRKGRVYFLLLKNKKNHWIFGVCLLFGFVILSGVVRLNSQIVGAAGDYSVAYVIQNDWGTGATINFTITNNGAAAINNWKLTWTFPGNQHITSLWNGIYTQNGTAVTVANQVYNGTVAANGGKVSFGFCLSYSGLNEKPTSFTLNGTTLATTTASVTNSPTLTPNATVTPVSTATVTVTSSPTAGATVPESGRQMEALDRGVVAIKVSSGVFVSWRVLGTEFSGVAYNLYRGATKVNATPITGATNYLDTAGATGSTYAVSAVVNGTEQTKSDSVGVWNNNYLQIPLQIPAGGTTPDGVAYTYSANDCSVGDLDGDHQYEVVVKWEPSNSKDNSQSGYTGNVYLDAYKLDGSRLWRIDLGRNIRAGAHYTQFMVYDLDGDGKSEVACKIADGTVDGQGNTFGSATADYRNSNGYILSGPEYLGLFSGTSGRLLEYVSYQPPRGAVSNWGDSYGNRVDRFLACVAYLDGVQPSLVMCRGYYTRTVLVAWDYRDGSLSRRWTFDSDNGYSTYAGQGNHNLSVADVDADGKDEIVYGACTIDDNGQGLYNSRLGHGDAIHLGDLNPNRTGLEVWSCFESSPYGAALRDAKTGKIIFKWTASKDTGRACSADLLASSPGEEMWASGGSALFSCTGTNLGSAPSQINHAIWWDGDDLRELLDGTVISKYGGGTLLSAGGCVSINGTKSNPCLQADILGDWREEVIWPTSDSRYLRIYSTTATTSRRLFTLMHDPVYRLGIAWQNVAYNQPPHVGFYLGNGMADPTAPDIYLAP
jgi:rhamnogalacturonan endolyase